MNLTDFQVLTLIRDHPGSNLYQLRKYALKDMAQWRWSIGKIQKAVSRLRAAGKVQTNTVLEGGRAGVRVQLSKI